MGPLLVAGAFGVPAAGGVVVVGTGVGYAVVWVVVGQVGVVARAAEAELEHAHPRQAPPLQREGGGGVFGAEVLGHDRQAGQVAREGPQQGVGGHVAVAAPARVGVTGRHLVGAREADEVVDAHAAVLVAGVAQALAPPGEALFSKVVPVVDGVAPQLSGLAEVVGRHPGHDGGAAGVGVEPEGLAVGPHVGRVEVGVDREVAEELHALPRGVVAQGGELPREDELPEGHPADGTVVGFGESRDGRGVGGAQLGGPGRPLVGALLVGEHAPQGVVVDPEVGLSPKLELAQQVGRLRRPHRIEPRAAVLERGRVVDALPRTPPSCTPHPEPLHVDVPLVAREHARGRVGRVAEGRGGGVER